MASVERSPSPRIACSMRVRPMLKQAQMVSPAST
jgi:hypothetical protein